ncbi:MAG TPA: hypothetical protein VII99_04020 [Bacteroidia bacterium]
MAKYFGFQVRAWKPVGKLFHFANNMTHAKIPHDAEILIELGKSRPEEVSYDTFRPFKILWVVTNGRESRNYLWVAIRKSGIYCAFGGPGNIYTSYHSDGKFHWRIGEHTKDLEKKPPLPNIPVPILIQNSTTVITDDALEMYQLTNSIIALTPEK